MDDMEFVEIAAASAWLGVHRQTVRKYVRAGRLGCYRFGNRVRFTPQQIMDFLDTVREGPKTHQAPEEIPASSRA
jgi:excisionase family DNA binding protein